MSRQDVSDAAELIVTSLSGDRWKGLDSMDLDQDELGSIVFCVATQKF